MEKGLLTLHWIKNNKKRSLIITLVIIVILIVINQIINSNKGITDKEKIESHGVNIKSFGAKGDGVSDDTKAIKRAFNSEDVSDLYFPSGKYLITSPIIVTPGTTRHVSGGSDVVISVKLAAGENLLELSRNISFENIVFDFNHGFLRYGMFFHAELGNISLKNIKFKNIKDSNSNDGTIIVYIETQGNRLNVQDIAFEDMQKKGNGVITDYAGNLTCLYITNVVTSSAVGKIKGVRINNIHNIDSKNNITNEDTSGIYVITSKNDNKNDLHIEDVYGYNFGKRLIKLHASNVNIKKVYAYSETNDALSAIFVNSGEGLGEKVNSVIEDVTIRGKAYIALAAVGRNTTFRNIDIKIEKTTPTSNSQNTGILIMGDNVVVENAEIEAERPIFLERNTDSSGSVKNTRLKNVELRGTDGGS